MTDSPLFRPNLKYRVVYPISSFEINMDGSTLSFLKWENGRMSECRINGVLVDQITFRRHMNAWKYARPRTRRPKR